MARSERGRAARPHSHRGRGVLAPGRQRRGQRRQGEDLHRLGLGSRALWPCGLVALWPLSAPSITAGHYDYSVIRASIGIFQCVYFQEAYKLCVLIINILNKMFRVLHKRQEQII